MKITKALLEARHQIRLALGADYVGCLEHKEVYKKVMNQMKGK